MCKGGACDVGDELFHRFCSWGVAKAADPCAKEVQCFVEHVLVLMDEDHEPAFLLRNVT